MAITDSQLLDLETNTVSVNVLSRNMLYDDYYMAPFLYIRDTLHIHLCCTGAEFKHACEIAHDEDIAPHDASLEVIVDGVLAMVFSDYLEACGIDLVSYFTYRFAPPSQEFQNKLDAFEEMVNVHKLEVVS